MLAIFSGALNISVGIVYCSIMQNAFSEDSQSLALYSLLAIIPSVILGPLLSALAGRIKKFKPLQIANAFLCFLYVLIVAIVSPGKFLIDFTIIVLVTSANISFGLIYEQAAEMSFPICKHPSPT